MAKPKEGYHDLFAQVPEELWQALADDAERSQRSATGQLIWLLRQQYPHAIATGKATAEARADEPKTKGKRKSED